MRSCAAGGIGRQQQPRMTVSEQQPLEVRAACTRSHAGSHPHLLVPPLAVAGEDPIAQQVVEDVVHVLALRVVVEARLEDVLHVLGVRGQEPAAVEHAAAAHVAGELGPSYGTPTG